MLAFNSGGNIKYIYDLVWDINTYHIVAKLGKNTHLENSVMKTQKPLKHSELK